MKNAGIILGLLVVLGLAMGGYMVYQQQQAEIATLEIAVVEEEQKVAALEQKVVALGELVEDLTKVEKPAAPEAPSNPIAAMPEGMEVPEDFDPAELFKQMIPDDEKKGGMSGMMDMFKGEEGKKMREMGARMNLNMLYGELFTELGLDPEREDALKALIMESMTQQIEMGMGAFDKDFDAEAMVATQKEAEEKLASQVKELLNPDEYDQYAEYEAHKEERVLKQSLEMQLGMFGGAGLSVENRAMAIDTIIEEFQVLQSGAMDPVEMMSNPLAMYDNALERLDGAMEPDQLAHVENFVQQQRDMMEAAAAMMGGEFGALLGTTPEAE